MEKLKAFILSVYLNTQYYIIVYLNAIEHSSKWIVTTIFRVDLLDEKSFKFITTTIYILLHMIILSIFFHFVF